jgi:methylglutaconyl-CoA hydratase
MVLQASGKSFCAGADLGWMKRAASYSYEENRNDAVRLSEMLQNLNTLPFPTIAKVQGMAFGGGVGLISACDMAIALNAPSVFFSLSEVKLGILPATISPYVVARIGPCHARRFFLTAERFNVAKAREIGLLHETTETIEEMDAMVDSWVRHILEASPTAIAASKELIRSVQGKEINSDVLLDTAVRLCDQRTSPEGKEGLGAFLEKRKPAWHPHA